VSFSRNSPISDSAGKPPPAGSLTPGVVNRKLIVETNSATANTLPVMEGLGAIGLSTISTAAASSNTRRAENV
jgi:hypothetical protein